MSEISRLSHIATKEASFPTKMFDPDTAMKPTAVRTIACSSLAITRRVSRRDMIQAAMVMVTDTELGVFMMCQVAIYRGVRLLFRTTPVFLVEQGVRGVQCRGWVSGRNVQEHTFLCLLHGSSRRVEVQCQGTKFRNWVSYKQSP